MGPQSSGAFDIGTFAEANNSSVGNNDLNLSADGDQILAFTGAATSPTFLFGIQSNSTQWQTNSNDSNQSDLPAGLINDAGAVAAGASSGAESEFDNIFYTGITTGTQTDLLAAIGDSANWSGSNSAYTPPTSFIVTAAIPEPVTATTFLIGLGLVTRRHR